MPATLGLPLAASYLRPGDFGRIGTDLGIGVDGGQGVARGQRESTQCRGGQDCGQGDRGALPRAWDKPGGIRPQWLSLSWTSKGAGRRGARSRTQVLAADNRQEGRRGATY